MTSIRLPLRFALVAASLTVSNANGGIALQKVSNRQSPTASFTPPEGCVPDLQLVRERLATQACIEQFSPTHEFILALHEYRVRNNDPAARPSTDLAKGAVEELVAKLYKENSATPGQDLANFHTIPTPPAGLPSGANYCLTLWTVVFDRRVPGYGNQEFRMMAYDFICGRADLSDDSLQVVDLRASERFNVAADIDRVKQRFSGRIIPFEEFDAATRTLKLFP